MLHLIVTVEVRPERLQEWYAVSRAHAEASRAEPGCVAFDVLGTAPRFIFREVWRDRAALQRHRETEHYARWRNRIAGIEKSPHSRAAEYEGPAKLIAAPLLPFIAEVARDSGRQVVFTNGVFGWLHPGHCHLLAEARLQGDTLVVGVNSDGSVAAIKPGRPAQPLADRLALLSAMEAVDYVVSFDAPTPDGLLRMLRPDVLVKGAEGREAIGAEPEHAGRVHYVELLPGYSTTETIRRLRVA